jgi:hypothetical protein
MNHLKEFCKRPEENIEFFLTCGAPFPQSFFVTLHPSYADNFAIVFFKKQGFKMPVRPPLRAMIYCNTFFTR